MLKRDRIDYRLINLALVVLIIYLCYKTGRLWMGIVDKILGIIIPFVIAFAVAYALYPFVQKLAKKMKKWLALTIVITASFAIAIVVLYIFTKVLVGELSDLFGSINKFMNDLMEMDLNVDIAAVKKSISNFAKSLLCIIKSLSFKTLWLFATAKK